MSVRWMTFPRPGWYYFPSFASEARGPFETRGIAEMILNEVEQEYRNERKDSATRVDAVPHNKRTRNNAVPKDK